MDSRADDRAALRDRTQRCGDELARRGEDDRGVELLGRRPRAGPLGSERARERLGGLVTLTREREHAAALGTRDLRDDVGGGAEPVQSEPLGIPRHAERAVADQAAAEERCERGGVTLGEREAEALVGDDPFGVAAVDVVAGEASLLAEVFAAAQAVAAAAAGPAEPRHPEAPPVGCDPDDLVAGHERKLRIRSSSPSTTCRSVRHTPQAATCRSSWPGALDFELGRLETCPRSAEHHRPHAFRVRRSGGPGGGWQREPDPLPKLDPALECPPHRARRGRLLEPGVLLGGERLLDPDRDLAVPRRRGRVVVDIDGDLAELPASRTRVHEQGRRDAGGKRGGEQLVRRRRAVAAAEPERLVGGRWQRPSTSTSWRSDPGTDRALALRLME